MIKSMIGFSLIVYAIGLLLQQSILPWTLGIALGLIIAILKLKLMEKALNVAVTLPEGKAKAYTQRQYMLRYLVTGLVLFVAAIMPHIHLLGVFMGLLSMKIGAYVELYNMKKE